MDRAPGLPQDHGRGQRLLSVRILDGLDELLHGSPFSQAEHPADQRRLADAPSGRLADAYGKSAGRERGKRRAGEGRPPVGWGFMAAQAT